MLKKLKNLNMTHLDHRMVLRINRTPYCFSFFILIALMALSADAFSRQIPSDSVDSPGPADTTEVISADSILSADQSVPDLSEEQETIADDGFAPGLGLMVLVAVGVLIILAVVGVVIAALLFLLTGMLIIFGVVSASALVGVYQRSYRKGIKTFVVLICGTGGLISGVALLYGLNYIMHWMSEVHSNKCRGRSGFVCRYRHRLRTMGRPAERVRVRPAPAARIADLSGSLPATTASCACRASVAVLV